MELCILGRRSMGPCRRLLGLVEEEGDVLGGIPEACTLTSVECKRVSKIHSPAPSTWPNTA